MKLVLDESEKREAKGHRFCGYYFPYPGPEQHQGLVSTISDDPPALNWIFVDGQTGMVRHGGRKDTLGHVIGPWGWTDDEAWLTLEGGPGGFVARREAADEAWVVYWARAGGEEEEAKEEVEEVEEVAEGGEHGKACRQRAVRLRRRPLLGLESRYVRDSAKA